MPSSSLSDDARAGARVLRVPFRCAPGGNPVLGARPVPAAEVRQCSLDWSQCFGPGVRGPAHEPTCSCGHLAYPLGPDDPLPDHICAQTMRASVRQWAVEESEDLRAIPLAWPRLHKGRWLILVLRQWVRGPGNELLPRLLARNPHWDQIADVMRRYHRAAEQAEPIIQAEARKHGITWSAAERRVAELLAVARDERLLLRWLEGSGLPGTLDVLAYARAVATGNAAPDGGGGGPVLGHSLLVTTKVYAATLETVGVQGQLEGLPFRWEWDEEREQPSVLVTRQCMWPGASLRRERHRFGRRRSCPGRHGSPAPLVAFWFHDGRPSSAIEGDSASMTQELLSTANRKRQEHLAWLGRWRPGVLTDRRARQRLLAAYDEPRSLSCLQEALDPRRIEALEKKVMDRPGALNRLIKEHLDASYRTVKEAARRAERAPIIERGWRKTAQAHLRSHLLPFVSGDRVDK